MPSYIELDKNGSFPSSSNVGRVVLGVNTSGEIVTTDNNGLTHKVVGATGATGPAGLPYGVYTSLLSQYSSEEMTGGVLVKGETYVIDYYNEGDDFSNIAQVISGTINTNGCIFKSTGIVPANWSNGSGLIPSNNPIPTILDNTLGFEIDWLHKHTEETLVNYFKMPLSVDVDKIVSILPQFNPVKNQGNQEYFGGYDITNTLDFDTTFDTSSGFNSNVYTIATQSDGKILVGGDFGNYNGTDAKEIIRLNSDATIDSSFVYGDGFNSDVYTIAVQSDGKILVGGKFRSYNGSEVGHIVRLNSDGSIDETFTGTFNSDVLSIVMQPDGKILAGGNFTGATGDVTAHRIVRLNSDGSVDSSFVIGEGFNSEKEGGFVSSLALQSDGKVVVGGVFTSYNGNPANFFARLNSNGSLDYGADSTSGFDGDHIQKVLIQHDGKIVVGGDFSSFNSQFTPPLFRFNSDMTVDYGFYLQDLSGSINFSTIQDITQQSDGRLLIISNDNYNLVKLNLDGSCGDSKTPEYQFDGELDVVLAVSGTNQVYVGGSFTQFNGKNSCQSLCRLDDDYNFNLYLDLRIFNIERGFIYRLPIEIRLYN